MAQQKQTGHDKTVLRNQNNSDGYFKDGEFNGLLTSFDKNGKKKWAASFKDGKKNGLAIEWSENGEKKMVLNFVDDVLIH